MTFGLIILLFGILGFITAVSKKVEPKRTPHKSPVVKATGPIVREWSPDKSSPATEKELQAISRAFAQLEEKTKKEQELWLN